MCAGHNIDRNLAVNIASDKCQTRQVTIEVYRGYLSPIHDVYLIKELRQKWS